MQTTTSTSSIRTCAKANAEGLVEGSYTNTAGTLDYKLYRPATVLKRPPLLVMLHGCSQSATDFAAGTGMNLLSDECGGIVLYPEQSKVANFLGCWNWYDTKHQVADDGEPSMSAGMTRQVIADHNVDSNRVYVAGMSAGGAMAVILGQVYPDLYAAVGVHSGVAAGVAHHFLSAMSAMNSGPTPRCEEPEGQPVATIVFHGDCDNTVHPSNAEAVHAQARRRCGTAMSPCTPEQVDLPNGRAVTRRIQARTADTPGAELWIVHGGGHAWAGGSTKGSFTDDKGPDASREMLRFFLQQQLRDSPERKKVA